MIMLREPMETLDDILQRSRMIHDKCVESCLMLRKPSDSSRGNSCQTMIAAVHRKAANEHEELAMNWDTPALSYDKAKAGAGWSPLPGALLGN